MISLGCAKNLVDAEVMLGSLLAGGVEITNDPANADALIINTCSFIGEAQEESVDTILESAEVRAARQPGQAIIVSGCLPQRFREELPKLLPEVDAFMGVDQVSEVAGIVRSAVARRRQIATVPSVPLSRRRKIELPAVAPTVPTAPIHQVTVRPKYVPDFATPRFRLTPRHFAYVKIAEGCNHPCSFCTIPRMRGGHRSRTQADVVAEVRQLLKEGVKEINLISQDATYYGMDLRPDHRPGISSPAKFTAAAGALTADATTLCTLLRELNALPGKFWIRLLYTHPAHWTDELIRTIAECPKVARYVDMPLQHIHDLMLERMRRETDSRHIRDLIARIRAGVPGIALRTTFIVGFPGETERCFETLLDFIGETKFERLGIFAYSREESTRAGGMRGQCAEATKQERRQRAMAAQREVSRAMGAAMVGRQLNVLVEGTAEGAAAESAEVRSWEHGLIRQSAPRQKALGAGKYLVARGESDAPDIDGRVYVRGDLSVGEFAGVRVVGHTDYDLIAEPI
ncbi:MAG: 30S ribosomal protein S12 methylthiotransferase RimO [Pedosphaera sp.]|nr:30S ribosomal protein S12 methylthiotransferase RimO [Pedosphaera sp.]MSU42616.1 30S ribosomal protein S12 methylthiotransferase RimO [Pedosphaera sp.]